MLHIKTQHIYTCDICNTEFTSETIHTSCPYCAVEKTIDKQLQLILTQNLCNSCKNQNKQDCIYDDACIDFNLWERKL